MTLDEICIKHGTDKGTQHPNAGHGYAPHYDQLFSALRGSPIKFLEIGVGGGESIRTWLEYFQQAKVFGVDSNPDAFHEPADRYTFCLGDQSKTEFWEGFITEHGSDWDVIVDDGGHFANQIITTYNALWPKVKSGGFYCIEDFGVCYGAGTVFVPAGWPRHIDFLKDRVDELQTSTLISWIRFSKELAIFCKV